MQARILFVCLGNICRSPTAEGAFRHVVQKRGFKDRFQMDSCGTAGYHTGELPDGRTRKVAREAGIDLTHRARRIRTEDLDDFDLILTMDRSNHEDVLALASTSGQRKKVRLFRSFDPEAGDGAEVPDPYYGNLNDFQLVQEICLRTSEALLDALVSGKAGIS
ncbi:MAG: low molecular weight phosphotyrosine protein phosphatase [Spirochaetales bacterium]|nr:low molecular weight phosphotyrosine protein phosphatase [Spirochaetales bacterium]